MSCGGESSVGGETPPPLAMENEFQNRKATPRGEGHKHSFLLCAPRLLFSSLKSIICSENYSF